MLAVGALSAASGPGSAEESAAAAALGGLATSEDGGTPKCPEVVGWRKIDVL